MQKPIATRMMSVDRLHVILRGIPLEIRNGNGTGHARVPILLQAPKDGTPGSSQITVSFESFMIKSLILIAEFYGLILIAID